MQQRRDEPRVGELRLREQRRDAAGHDAVGVGLDRLSVVAANYEANGTEGVVGVIGPTRMDYARAVSAVRTVADGLTEALG